jgi:hypothetical protein
VTHFAHLIRPTRILLFCSVLPQPEMSRNSEVSLRVPLGVLAFVCRRQETSKRWECGNRARLGRAATSARNPDYSSSLLSLISNLNCQPSKLISMRPNSRHVIS